jgi:uncharacterized phiE125 gp8 family phage protein
MSAILLTPPAIEPLSLEEARGFLRVDYTDDDALIASLVAAARMQVETHTRRALITQSWRLVADRWPADGRIAVVPAPLQSLLAVRVYDCANNGQALDVQAFVPDLGASALLVEPWTMPAPGRPQAGIELDVVVGYGGAATDVPEPLRQAMRLLVAHWYDNRGLTAAGEAGALPQAVATLIAPYRTVSL